jgi:HlyD family secretion protein
MQPASSDLSARGSVTPIRDTSSQDRPINPAVRHRRRIGRIAAAAIAAILLALIAVTLLRHWTSAEKTVPASRVRIAQVERGRFVREIAARGTVVAAVSPTLFAPSGGTVAFLVKAGDRVSKGTALARLDSPQLRNELEREQASLAGLEIAVERQSIDTRRQILASQQQSDLAGVAIEAAERELRRAEDSWALRLISERDYEKARDDAAAARLTHRHAIESAALEKESLEFELKTRRLERDRQRLLVEDLQRRVADLDVVSPVDGVVGSLTVADRSAVAASAPLLTVVDLTEFEIEFEVPETYADDLGLGMRAEVDYDQRAWPVTVSAVSPEVRDNQVTGRLRFERSAPGGLRQNQRVAARILLDARDGVLKVERGPFIDSGAGRVAYVVRDGIAVRTPITIGATSVTEVEILSGLAAGDRIVVSGLDGFDGAQTVRLAD